MHSKSHSFYAGILSICLAACIAGSVRAATINVSTTTDEDNGSLGGGAGISLREAIKYSAAGDTISVPAGTYNITIAGVGEQAAATGDIDIAKSLTITGVDRNTTIVDGGALDRVFDVTSGTVVISNLTMRNGLADTGGCFYNRAICTLNNCAISGSRATNIGGGGVYNAGSKLTLNDCLISGNTTVGATQPIGGGLQSQAGTTTLNNCTVDANLADYGAGMFAFFDGVFIVNGGTFSNNVATTTAGGAYNYNNTSGDVVFNDVTFTANTAVFAGGIFNEKSVTVNRSTFLNNRTTSGGGGFYNDGAAASAVINDSTFTGNQIGSVLNGEGVVSVTRCLIEATGGEGFTQFLGSATLINTTITGSGVNGNGGGVRLEAGTCNITSCTIANNTATLGGGVYVNTGVTAFIQSSIIARNTGTPAASSDVSGTFVAGSSYNLIGIVDGGTGFDAANNNILGTAAAPVDPRLAALADNGGRSRTIALQTGSPALDAGVSGGILGDQRQFIRTVNIVGTPNAAGGDGTDIGALEMQTPFFVINTNDSGAGSLRQAMADAALNTNPIAPSTVMFRITSNPPYTISPILALPIVSSQTIIDATTQTGFTDSPIVELNGASVVGAASGFVLANHSGSAVRGFIINRFSDNGIDIELGGTHHVALNYIGTDAGATAARPNGFSGVRIFNSSNNVIGGDILNSRNVISGNGANGVLIESALSANNLVQGNHIGTGALTAVKIPNTQQGVLITTGASSNIIGSDADGANDSNEGNVIANNVLQGVFIDSGNANKVQSNSIDGNGGIGIDIGTTGADTNDAGDVDIGANGLQNYPVLNSLAGTTAGGFIDSTPNATFRIEVFNSPAFDASGNGEGATFLGAANATTDAQGIAAFTVTLSAAPTGVLTATATGANGTSEFSAKNVAPTISVPAAVTTSEDVSVFIQPIVAGDPDAGIAIVELSFQATHGNTTIDTSVNGGIAAGDVTANGTHNVLVRATIAAINASLGTGTAVSYKGDLDYNGSDTLRISIDDKAPPALGGGQAAIGNVAITITAVVDRPKITNVTTLEDTQTPTGVIVESVDGPQFTFFKITAIQNGRLFQNDGVTEITNSTFVPAAEAKLGLKFTPATDSNISGTFVAQQSTSSDDAGLTGPTSTGVITVTAVADAPTLTVQDVSGNEGAALALQISPALKDTDGSEVVSVQLTGVPPDAIFSNGVQNPGNGTVDIAQADLANLTITIPDNQANNAAYVLTVDAIATEQSNNDTETTTKTLRVTVANVAPAMTNISATSVNENGTVHVVGTMTDPGADSLILTVDWGDGAPEDFPFSAGTTTFDVSHQYLDDNPTNTGSDLINIGLTLKDKDNAQTTANTPSTITNVAPVGVVATGLTALEGTAVNFNLGTFTDVGPIDTHSAKVDWGDGTPQTDAVITEAGIDPGSINAAHAYADNRATPYDVVITLKDDDGGTHVLNTTVTVSNVVPTAEFRKADTANTATLGAVRFSLQSDPSSADTTAGFHYAFDFNNDSSFDLGDGTYAGSQTTGDATVPPNFITSNPNQTVRGRIIDKDNGFKDYLLRKPTVTSALTTTANIGSQFTYIITGDGEPQLPPLGPQSSVFLIADAGGTLTLAQAGLVFTNGNRISGIIPDIVGTVKLKITASTLAGTDEVTLTINVRDPNNLNDPTFTSPATASPALTLVNIPVQFSAAGTDADNNPITFSWAFGDGTTGTGPTPTHAYTAPGTFTAVVTLNDGRYSVTQEVVVTVLDPSVNPVTVTGATLSFDFKTNTKHSLSLKGSVGKGTLTGIPGAVIDFIIVGSLYERVFTLDAKGGAKVGTATFKAKLNTKTNIISWSIAEKSPQLFTQLTGVGFKNETTAKTGKNIPMGVIMKVGTDPHAALLNMIYKATQGKSGKAAKAK